MTYFYGLPEKPSCYDFICISPHKLPAFDNEKGTRRRYFFISSAFTEVHFIGSIRVHSGFRGWLALSLAARRALNRVLCPWCVL